MGWVLTEIHSQLKQHQKDLEKEIGVVIVNEAEMRDINSKHREKQGATDVLSFEGSHDHLGEVVLCRELVIKQSLDHGLDESEELAYLLLHGVLHLLGYDHEKSEADAEKMFAIQDKIFEFLTDQDIVKKFKAQ